MNLDLDRGVSEIVCAECRTSPRLKSLDKNEGTQLMCDCDDLSKSLDAVPYELAVRDLPDDWVVIEGRTAKQLGIEVDACIDAGLHECPACDAPIGLADSASCDKCGFIPEEHRA